MNANAMGLLAKLGSGVRPVADVARTSASTPAGGVDSFAALLDAARAGEVSSGLPVSVDPSLDLTLSDDDLQRLAEGADRATAAGAERALLTMDGRGYVLDVGSRTITASHDLNGRTTLAGIDTVVGVAPEDPGAGTPASGPPLAWRSASLLTALCHDQTTG